MRHRGRAVRYEPEDRLIFNGVMERFCQRREEESTGAGLMISIGKHFLGVPYGRNTLEVKGGETLVVNLREFDCFTFVENVMVLAVLIKRGKRSFDDYAALLKRSRYRDGIVAGYASRLHYFSEWLSDNEKKGIIRDVTREMGGKRCVRKIHYMTSHRDNYPPLNSERVCGAMHTVERNLSEKPFYHIPKEELPRIRGTVKDGDIIAVTTDVEGLDVVHVGMAACIDRAMHLLHASDIEKKVVISDAALPKYLSSRKTMTGIMVGRIRQGCGSPSQ